MATANWSKPEIRGDLVRPSAGHSLVSHADCLFLFGGFDAHDTFFPDLYRMKLGSEYRWEHLNPTGIHPAPRKGHRAKMVDHMMLIFGGNNKDQYFNDCFLYDTESNKWTCPQVEGPHIPPPRTGHWLCRLPANPKQFLLFGGHDNATFFNDLWLLDVTNFNKISWQKLEPSGDMPTARAGMRMAISSDDLTKVYMHGGFTGNIIDEKHLSDMYCLDLKTYTWKNMSGVAKGDIPVARCGHKIFTVGESGHKQLCILGGRGPNTHANEMCCFDPHTSKFSTVTQMGKIPAPRSGYGCATIGDRMFIIGGWCPRRRHCFSDMFELTFSTK